MAERLMILVGYDDAELLDIACVTTSLTTANRLGANPAYAVSVATPGSRAITETLRQAFVSRYGTPPSRYRATQSPARR